MTLLELKTKLNDLGIAPKSYSLDGNLEPDRMIIRPEGGIWRVFYFDERGNRCDERAFENEDKACECVYEYFVQEKDFEKKYGVKG